MSNATAKSITVRLDEEDLARWAHAQNSASSSVRMAIKMAMLMYGSEKDLPDAILESRFGKDTGNAPPFIPESAPDHAETDFPDTVSVQESVPAKHNPASARRHRSATKPASAEPKPDAGISPALQSLM